MTDTNASLRKRPHIKPKLAELYDASFYENQVARSVQSARIYLKFFDLYG
jgi:hypothetical protein